MKLVNLTPHSLVLRSYSYSGVDRETGLPVGEKVIYTVIPSTGVAFAEMEPRGRETIAGVPVPVYGAGTPGNVIGLPEVEDPDALYIVSELVAASVQFHGGEARPGDIRRNLVCPGFGPADGAIRNQDGAIIPVTRLVRV